MIRALYNDKATHHGKRLYEATRRAGIRRTRKCKSPIVVTAHAVGGRNTMMRGYMHIYTPYKISCWRWRAEAKLMMPRARSVLG